ncbi:biorientation of chromosomes in cell division protein 1-like 1 [Sabethes cyaneus]|uniref:biorientation of chromosomes in cell division protein 1-like 1 n=1 Tax=Sabethes cyaneus TaxID=53552 RepID=UPI00237E3E51|nr:biorientation of chromosomes in cell division protein 1-like 1 [Sabethes cyaneus]
MENLADDPSFIDAIVHEVKSKGHFDQFRKECLADVDTKPAYQNLRQRVETSVSKFLSQQNWTADIRHKNQLREKLRKNIIDSGFLETGVERIVDQVVNPKISTVFHPKVEEIVYNYLGIEKPKPTVNGSGLDIQTDFLPEDLEAVSPDSDKKSSSTSSDLQNTLEHSTIEPELNESKEIIDDFESPAFEPLQIRPPSETKQESSDSNTSVISGLTSQESIEEDKLATSVNDIPNPKSVENVSNTITGPDGASAIDGDATVGTTSPEAVANDSQLSQVSSNSRLSIVTSSEGNLHQQQSVPNPRLDITEEAQMPKFNENSNEEEGEIMDSDESKSDIGDQPEPPKSNFDLHKESYEFKGTERSSRMIENENENEELAESETVLQQGNDINCDIDDGKDRSSNQSDEQPKQSPCASNKYDDDSSQSERSLRICEDSTMEQKAMDTSSHVDNCDSAKTPLNDEHSTESAPDVEKIDGSQVEVVTLAAVQQHADGEKGSERRRVSRKHQHRDNRKRASSSSHRHRTSSSRERRSHSSSKHGSSTSGSGSRKSDQHDRKSENGNSHPIGNHSKRSLDKKKVSDDHYSSHEKSKKRRSTDRDSNDGAENAKSSKPGGESYTSSGTSGNKESAKNSSGSQRQSGGSQEENSKLNESMESNFEGFDEEQMTRDRKHVRKGVDKSLKAGKKQLDVASKAPRKTKRNDKSSKDTTNKQDLPNMEVFSFSFEKPSKPSKQDEQTAEETSTSSNLTVGNVTIADDDPVLRADDAALPAVESLDQLAEGVIILEPTEIKNVTSEELFGVTHSTDDTSQLSRKHFSKPDSTNMANFAVQPVVVDQILSHGDSMDLELLIGEKQFRGDESTLDKIQQGLNIIKNKAKKPKIASNFNEARRLMKVRKQIEKKTREQAMVLVKQLINNHGDASDNEQGVELESASEGSIVPSSPVRPRTNAKIVEEANEEEDLLYFPEAKEVFPTNIGLLEYLQQKISSVSCSTKVLTECSNEDLGTDKTKQVVTSSSFCFEKTNESLISGDAGLSKPDVYNNSILCEANDGPNEERNASSILNNRNANSQLESKSFVGENRRVTKREHSNSPSGLDYKVFVEDKTNDSADSMILEGNNATIRQSAPNPRIGKARRIGLSKPKNHNQIGNSISTELNVVISEATPAACSASPTANNNNNGAIKGQRYSTDDLYKPRPTDGLRSRTRTRAGEVQ